jgi:ribonuclease BN (tRNA processing enzyme)
LERGGPRPRKTSSAAAQVIVTNNPAYVIDCGVGVTAALVDHPPVVPAFGYRFDAHDRSIVISGDTAPSDNLVRLAGVSSAAQLKEVGCCVPSVCRPVATSTAESQP